jgi:hypothetical protein
MRAPNNFTRPSRRRPKPAPTALRNQRQIQRGVVKWFFVGVALALIAFWVFLHFRKQ